MDDKMKLCTDCAGNIIGKGLAPQERAAAIQNIAGFPDLTRDRIDADTPAAEEILVEQFRLAGNDGVDAAAELARLRSRLPISKDGVTQIPMLGCLWDVVFLPHPYVRRLPFWKWFENTGPGGVWHVGAVLDGHWKPVLGCYSTVAAARIANPEVR